MFVSVLEAVELTGMSQTTIYRLCKKRNHTEYVKKDDNKYFIDKEYLLATYPETIEDNQETPDHQFGKKTLNTPEDELIEFSDDQPTAIEKNIMEDIVAKIKGKFNTPGLNSDTHNEESRQVLGTPWESIIGVSLGVLLITAFIFMLYFSSK